MNRKGKLTTKGKHALILALTIAACVTAMLFSLLLSVLCDGKYVSSAAHAGDISHPALITGKQRQDTDLLTPQWLYYQSDVRQTAAVEHQAPALALSRLDTHNRRQHNKRRRIFFRLILHAAIVDPDLRQRGGLPHIGGPDGDLFFVAGKNNPCAVNNHAGVRRG